MKNDLLWSEKYRPDTVDDCILPKEPKSFFKAMIKKGSLENMIFSGSHGVGKTTVARAICKDMEADMMFLNCSKNNSIDDVRTRITSFASSMSMKKRKKVIVGDEFDYFTPNGQAALRGVIEEVSNNCRFVFTCNYANKIIDPIKDSRTEIVNFHIKSNEKSDLAKQFMKRCCFILDEEGIKYEKSVVAQLIMKRFPDFRKTISSLARAAITYGEINASVLNDVNTELTPYIEALKEKDFRKAKKFIFESSVDPNDLFYGLSVEHINIFTDDTKPIAIKLINDSQYKHAFVMVEETNLMAMTICLMSECNYT